MKIGIQYGMVTTQTEERKCYSWVSRRPVIMAKFWTFSFKGSKNREELAKVKTLSELKHFTLIHYTGNGWPKKKLSFYDVIWKRSLDNFVSYLSTGRVDICIDPYQVIKWDIRGIGVRNKIISSPQVLDNVSFRLLTSKKLKWKTILEDFDKIIEEIKKDGSIQNISDNYK